MFQAIGRAVQRNRDNTFTVKVEFFDERTQKTARFQDYTVPGLTALKPLVKLDLQALKDAEQDVTLNAAVVGVVIAEI